MEEVIDLESMWEEYRMADLESGIRALFPQYHIDLKELFTQFLSGDVIGALTGLFEQAAQGLFTELSSIRNILIYLLVLGVIAALLTNFADIFENHQIADVSFYFVYLILIGILLRCFYSIAQTAVETLSNIVTFIQLFIPTYFVAVGVATGTSTAGAYYHLLLWIIFGVEYILFQFLLPLINGFLLLSVINGIWTEERLALMIDFVEKCIRFILKAAIGVVTGISLFQSVITPVLDSVKSSALQKAVSAIPGVGNAADGVVELVIGSAVLIKNSIGVVLLALLILLCAVPLMRIFIISCLIKLAAAVLGIISDKRITNCTSKVGDAGMLLFKTAGTAMVLFVITIAVAAYATNRGY